MKPLRQPTIAAAGALALAGVFLTGCLEQPNPISSTPVEPVVIPDFAIVDVVVGTGIAAAIGNFVDVTFTLWLYDETQPDEKGEQVTTSTDPVNVLLDPLQVIDGWIQGVPGMREGGLRRLILPPALAFGGAGSGAVPPNTPVVYEIELLRVDETPDFTITDLVVGTGATAAGGDTLTVDYGGWVYDPTEPDNKGAEFDASNGTPFEFVLGDPGLVDGWNMGILGLSGAGSGAGSAMRVGGSRRLILPPALAFGQTGQGLIPPNATVVFDIELLTVE
jgi:FKBP-type peptidyl-prolyl cis-trans isomerase